jgi:hypothetical protein
VVRARPQLNRHPLGRGEEDMIRRAIVGLALAAAFFALSAAVFSGVYVFRHYIRHLPEVDRLVRELPPEEANPPQVIRDLVPRLNPNFRSFVISKLVGQFSGPIRMSAWHARNFIWLQLLPHRLTQHEMLALYSHFMPFEGGSGLAYGARHYFGKVPAQLTELEALELFVISVSPSGNSPTQNPERFKAAVERFRARLGTPAA